MKGCVALSSDEIHCHSFCSHHQTSGCVFCWLSLLKLRAIFKRCMLLNSLQVYGYALLKIASWTFQWTSLDLEENSIVPCIYKLHTWEVVCTAGLLKWVTFSQLTVCFLRLGISRFSFFRLPHFIVKVSSLVVFLSETAVFIFTAAIIYLNSYSLPEAQLLLVVCKAQFIQYYKACSDCATAVAALVAGIRVPLEACAFPVVPRAQCIPISLSSGMCPAPWSSPQLMPLQIACSASILPDTVAEAREWHVTAKGLGTAHFIFEGWLLDW